MIKWLRDSQGHQVKCNTDTARLIHHSPVAGELYQNKGNRYFLVKGDSFTLLTAESARIWGSGFMPRSLFLAEFEPECGDGATTINISLPEPLRLKLDKIAKSQGCSASAIIQRWIDKATI